MRTPIDAKADVCFQKRGSGNTALIGAASYGHADCVRLLIEANASVHAATDNSSVPGSTALIMAAFRGHVNCATLLLEAKANVEAGTNDGSTACMMGAYSGHADCVRALIEAKADVEAATFDGLDPGTGRQTKMSVCANCRQAQYCSREHCVEHFAAHKEACRAAMEARRRSRAEEGKRGE